MVIDGVREIAFIDYDLAHFIVKPVITSATAEKVAVAIEVLPNIVRTALLTSSKVSFILVFLSFG